jgi:hypothetical protein
MRQGDRIQSGHQHNFFMIPNEMIDSHIENMTALGFVVYSVLMRHADAGSQCFPSYSTLERKSALSRPTIAKCIEHLVTKGYIRKLEIGHSKGHATTYQLLDLSLVPTSKGDLLVNEVNQPMSLTSKGDLPVTSKGDLPQLVNEVNSNNTHVTKPINNKTHIKKESDFFENSSLEEKTGNLSDLSKPEDPKTPPLPPLSVAAQKLQEQFEGRFKNKPNRYAPQGLVEAGFGEWHLGEDYDNWRPALIKVAQQVKRELKQPCEIKDATKYLFNIARQSRIEGHWGTFKGMTKEAIAIEQSQHQRSQQQPTPIATQEDPTTYTVPSFVKDFAKSRKAS